MGTKEKDASPDLRKFEYIQRVHTKSTHSLKKEAIQLAHKGSHPSQEQ